MAESSTLGVQVKVAGGPASTVVGIVRNNGDEVVIKTEKPNLELHFNYVPLLEFLYAVDSEQKKVKLKRM